MKTIFITIIFIVSWCVENTETKEKDCDQREFTSKKEAEHFYNIALLESKDTNSKYKVTNISFVEK